MSNICAASDMKLTGYIDEYWGRLHNQHQALIPINRHRLHESYVSIQSALEQFYQSSALKSFPTISKQIFLGLPLCKLFVNFKQSILLNMRSMARLRDQHQISTHGFLVLDNGLVLSLNF